MKQENFVKRSGGEAGSETDHGTLLDILEETGNCQEMSVSRVKHKNNFSKKHK